MKHLLIKEFLQFRCNAFLPRLVLLFPIAVMCIMPWVMDMEVKNVAVVVVDNDHSTVSHRIVERIKASDYFVYKGLRNTNAEAIADVEQSRADVVLTIPQHYGRDLETHNKPQILISANAVNGTKGSIGASYLSSLIAQYSSSNTPRSKSVSELYLYNKHRDYKLFMIPALMSILVMMLCGFLPALNIVGEKENGTIEQINVSPISRSMFILAKLIPYWIIGLLVLTVCFLLSWLVYGITSAGSLPLLYLVSMFLALFFSGFGLAISNHSDTMQQAILVMWFFVVCLMLLSGLFTPIASMPQWAQTLTLANPVRWYIDAMRTVFIRGGNLSDILRPTAILAVMSLAVCLYSVISYKKRS